MGLDLDPSHDGSGNATGSNASAGVRGFTLPELVAVLLMVSVLAAVAIPRLQGGLSFRDDGWRDQVVAALRLAHKTAVAHRRLVCADIGSAAVTVSIAAANPATACQQALPGLDGSGVVASSGGAAAASVSPAGTVYFQPSGRVSRDAAGSLVATRTVGIAGQASIVVVGETGHVE